MSTAVLLSGGLDSAVLVADEASAAGADVHPVYISVGLAWEAAERASVAAFLASAPHCPDHRRAEQLSTLSDWVIW